MRLKGSIIIPPGTLGHHPLRCFSIENKPSTLHKENL
ncbi:hypothetical protein CCHR01_19008 [Colletotrichum chrysophilum]|uniref:Uncharacterized protein n=1 Tax=Colletotrichum chrysophilum TaxID=1836956 RepID=A0AAD9E7L8_9PEZI|nr:hypothetical protein CCHR01_19008 [Colletotrichum chrysophilum]